MFTLVKLKNNTNITSTPEQPHHLLPPPPINHNLPRPHIDATLNPFLQWIPASSGEHLLSTGSTTGGMMGVVGKAERHREACPRGPGSGITWFRSRSSVSVPAGLHTGIQPGGSASLGPVLTFQLPTHSLVEGLGLVPQMFGLCHEVVQFFSPL